MPKGKRVLNPEILEKKMDKFNIELFKKAMLEKTEANNNGLVKDGRENTDNFFRAVITEMLSDKNISLKTEYRNANENFSGAKLEFLAMYTDMVFLKDFIRILEIKRVSLERKSRIELIKAFEKREEEIEAQNRLSLLRGLGGFQP